MAVTVRRKSRTMGALQRRFERDREFFQGSNVFGPAATHAGDNGGLALRFGEFAAKKVPNISTLRIGRLSVSVIRGPNAAMYAGLSDMELSSISVGPAFSVSWRIAPRMGAGNGI